MIFPFFAADYRRTQYQLNEDKILLVKFGFSNVNAWVHPLILIARVWRSGSHNLVERGDIEAMSQGSVNP
jgi:hypothetical protein